MLWKGLFFKGVKIDVPMSMECKIDLNEEAGSFIAVASQFLVCQAPMRELCGYRSRRTPGLLLTLSCTFVEIHA